MKLVLLYFIIENPSGCHYVVLVRLEVREIAEPHDVKNRNWRCHENIKYPKNASEKNKSTPPSRNQRDHALVHINDDGGEDSILWGNSKGITTLDTVVR